MQGWQLSRLQPYLLGNPSSPRWEAFSLEARLRKLPTGIGVEAVHLQPGN